jgi:hypothetical protein
MKPKKPKVNPQEAQAHYWKLRYQRTLAIGDRTAFAEDSEEYGELSKQIADLNEEIEEMEKEARV